MTETPLCDEKPDAHDYPAAATYLSLHLTKRDVDSLVKALKKAPITTYQAKDLLRASGLELLPFSDAHVAEDLAKVIKGTKLSPVLLVRGDLHRGVPLIIADDYHGHWAL